MNDGSRLVVWLVVGFVVFACVISSVLFATSFAAYRGGLGSRPALIVLLVLLVGEAMVVLWLKNLYLLGFVAFPVFFYAVGRTRRAQKNQPKASE